MNENILGEFINSVIFAMQPSLNDEQIKKLENTLYIKTRGLVVSKEITALTVVDDKWDKVLKLFCGTKRLENCSKGTIKGYLKAIQTLKNTLNKPIDQVTSMDIRWYLSMFQETHKASECYLDNIRRIFSSFFGWVSDEGYITTNPMRRVAKIKVPKKIKKTFSAEEREHLRCTTKCERDTAICDFLYSTALRVGEAVSVNRNDINFVTRELKVYGQKGKKERIVYITEECAFHLKKYLESRTDTNPALFVTKCQPYRRLSIGGIQHILKGLGNATGIHCHPHKYRRTLLTDGASRGIPLQELQIYAGHVQAQTTMEYVMTKQESVKTSYEKLIA